MAPIKPGLPDMRVELAPASDSSTDLASIVWRDLTSHVRLQDSVMYRRGRADERSSISAGDASLVVNNTSGKFTPGSTGFDGSSELRLGVPLRIMLRTATTAGNFLPNNLATCTFTGLADWAGAGGAAVATSATQVWQGASSAKITYATGGFFPGAATGANTVTGLTIGRVYTFSAYVYVTGAAPFSYCVVQGGAIGTANNARNTWQRISVTFTATATSHGFIVAAATAPTAGDITYVDGCQVEEGSTVVTWSASSPPIVAVWSGVVDELSPTMMNGTRPVVAVRAVDRWSGLAEYQLRSWESEHHTRTAAGCIPAEFLWSLTDSEQVPAVADTASGRAVSLTVGTSGAGAPGAVDFAAGALPVDDGTVCAFTPSGSNGYFLSGTITPVTGSASIDGASLLINSTVTAAGALLGLNGLNGNYSLLEITATGKVKLTNYDPFYAGHTVTGTTTVTDGEWHQVGYLGNTLYVDGVSEGVTFGVTAPVGDWFAMSVAGSIFGSLYSGQMSHVALYSTAATSGVMVSAYEAVTGAVGETSQQRFTRIASLLPVCQLGSAGGGGLTTAMGKQKLLGKTPTAAFADVEAAEQGVIFVDGTGGVCFAGRDERYNAPVAFTPGPADVGSDLSFTFNRAFVVNDITASRPGGTDVRVTNAVSVGRYGTRAESVSLPVATDDFVTQVAQYRANISAEPATRLNELPLDVWVKQNTIPVATAAGLDVGSRITSTGLPAPLNNFDVFVEGVSGVFDTRRGWTVTPVTSPVVTSTVWQLDTVSSLGVSTVLAL